MAETQRDKTQNSSGNQNITSIGVARDAHIVLNVPELLELVLYHVAGWPFFKIRYDRTVKDLDSFIDLYHCGLVCKRWKTIIETSPMISRRLFRHNDKQLQTPINYHENAIGVGVPSSPRVGGLLPTINYPFISWLAWRLPRCFQDSRYWIGNLHNQYVADHFPPSYFSSPPTAEIVIHLQELKFPVPKETWGPPGNLSVRYTNPMYGYYFPSQTFILRNEHGVTVEDIVRTISILIGSHERGSSVDVPSDGKCNIFQTIKVGIYKNVEEQGEGMVKRRVSLTHYGEFSVPETANQLQEYHIFNRPKLFSENPHPTF
ncbi:hypothetical protein TWF730_007047 [Orbilia blumenaviensis]|uniref:F-box domain-containing protein n=1 Tax=Orbilia blumenaviensis TaxID=1796055 RepID=A0AAV9VHI5_9PEZI